MSEPAAPFANPLWLETSEENLRDFFDNAPVGLHFVRPDGIILGANRTELAMLGYEGDEYIGKNIADFCLDKEAIADALARLLAGEELHEFEAEIRCKDGSSKYVMASCNARFVDGRFVHSRWFTRDVTGQRRSAEVAALLAAIVESSHDVIVSKTLDGTITSWNPTAEQVFGYTAAEAVGRSIRMIVPADRQDEEDEVLRRLSRGERVEHFETVRQRKDGKLIDMSLTISPLRDFQGRIIGASKVARDISAQKAAEEELHRLLSAKDDFLGLVSHELRTPLTTMKGTANVLRRRRTEIPESDRIQALSDIEAGAERLLGIVENMLTLARVENAAPEEMEPLLLARVISSFITEHEAESRGHSVVFDPGPQTIPVLANEGYLRLIIGNLLSNARKYSPWLSEINISLHYSDGFAEVQVSDSGIGITEDLLQHVFQPFFRAHAAAERATGIGLGLTVCKRLVEIQGGAIHAERRPGGGTTFAFTLPLFTEGP